ncbi:MAG: RNA-guided pseudouridylation complex pseudouridine synthase subunit Cbf5 [Candidatus Aenigmatarchaeota archaeon]
MKTIEQLLSCGIIVLDKWSGPTSHEVVSIVKGILNVKLAGQSGTLDPAVTGVLVITLNNACKIIPALQGQDKEYVGVMHLHGDVLDSVIQEALKKFTGKISQRPPVKSAVSRKTRKREIFEITVLDRKGNDVCLFVRCEAGTYIRKLFHDIGQELGCGAHMKELRRTMAGSFSENVAHRIDDLRKAFDTWQRNGNEELLRDFILPVEEGVTNLNKIIIKDSAVFSIINGSPVYSSGIMRTVGRIVKDQLVAIMSSKDELVAMGHTNFRGDYKTQAEKKFLAVKTDRVIMSHDVAEMYREKS